MVSLRYQMVIGYLVRPLKLLSPAAKTQSPVTLTINREEERDIVNPRCIVMSRDSEYTSHSDSNYSLNSQYLLSSQLQS